MKYNAEQKRVIECRDSYQQVIAAAGSGKTSTMVALLERILSDQEENSQDILVITFSRKAAGEIRERLHRKVGESYLKVKTFHAYCMYAIQKFHPIYRAKKIELIDDKEKEDLFREYFKREKYKVGGIPYKFLMDENSRMKKELPEIFTDLEIEYKNYKLQTQKMDFGDLIQVFLQALKENSDWVVCAKKEIKRIIVDEFQDTDLDQLEMLMLMRPEKLTVVGDDWQAIYGFRGASTLPFLKFSDFFSPCTVHFLGTNYRSLPEIINVSSIPISKNKMNIKKKIRADRNGKGFVRKITIENDFDLPILVEKIQMIPNFENEIKILCRSNYRIDMFVKAGMCANCLMTIHASKGLEFNTVLVDLFSGWNLRTNETKEILEEERRILYVALSRAKNQLIILGSKSGSKDRIEDLFYSYFKSIKSLELGEIENINGY